MANIESLVEDFALPELDSSKWIALGSGNYTIASPNGLKFNMPSAVNDYTTVQSLDSFVMYGRSVYWNAIFDVKESGYAKMFLSTHDGYEYGFMIESRKNMGGGNVSSVENSFTVKDEGQNWATTPTQQWKDSWMFMQGAEYKVVSNTKDTITVENQFIDVPPVGTGFSLNTPEVRIYSKTPAGVYTIHKTVTFNENAFRWFKISHSVAGRLYWWTSSDGVSWVLRDFKDNVYYSSLQSTKLLFQFTRTKTDGYPYPRAFTVKYVNTKKNIFRGSGYLSEDFNTLPVSSLTVNKQWGPFKQIAGNNSRITSDHTLTLRSSTVRTNLRTTIRDVDIRFDMKIGTTSGTVFWRANNDASTYVGLQIFPTRAQLFTVVNGTRTDIPDPLDINNEAGVNYSWRVIHAGSTIVVYRNGGDVGSQGVITYPTEIFRVTGVGAVNVKGHVGVLASTNDVSVDNLIIRPGVTPPAESGTTLGTYGTIPLPPSWPFDVSRLSTRIDSMSLRETGYNDLILFPTPAFDSRYGGIVLQDFDMGMAEFREYTENLSSVSGTNNFTATHGAKTITMTLAVLPGLGTTVNSLSAILDRWAYPSRRPSLVYKPTGMDERIVQLVPTPMSRPMTVEQNDLYTLYSVSFIVPSGIEEDIIPKQVLIDPSQTETVTVITDGTAEALPRILIYGPATNPTVYNDTLDSATGNARLGLTGYIDAGEFIELNARERTVRYMGNTDASANRRNMLTTRGWWTLRPWENNVRFESEEGTGQVVIEYRDAYL